MIQLRPPADADNYRVKAGRFGDRFYVDPLPADDTWPADDENNVYPAVSTIKKAVGQDWTRAATKRMAKEPSQLVEIGNIDSEFERKQRLNLLSDAGLDQASGRGTIVHAHAEATLMNRLPIYQMNDVVRPYIRTLDNFFAAYQPTLVAAEFVAIHRALNRPPLAGGCDYVGYGGTGDAVIDIDGKFYMVDWKSRAEDSDHKAYSEEGGQVSAYGKADYWIVGDDESPNGAKRIEPLELAGGLIVSIKPDSYEVFPIDLDDGFDYWTDLHAWWQARRSERKMVGRKWAPRVAPEAIEVSPTPASNKVRFDALPEVKKGWARTKFKQRKLNPNNAGTAGEVSRILGEIEHTPGLREAQETAAEQRAEHQPIDHQERDEAVAFRDQHKAEGGDAPEELVAEARLMFEMSIGKHGKTWTGHRVVEANEAGVSFRISEMATVKRAHLYLAVCRWAMFRGETLEADEAEGNIEFSGLLFAVDDELDRRLTIGHRLGSLTTAQAEQFATEINEVVQSEIGEQPPTETETQPASEPASEPTEKEE
jgi:hypothetical protein